jgi:glutamyl-tRNA synthetase
MPAFGEAEIEAALRSLAESSGLKAREFFGAVRVAVTGKRVAPPLFGSLAILGQRRAVARLREAVRRLEALE